MNIKFVRVIGKGKRGFHCTERRDQIRVMSDKVNRVLDGYVLTRLSHGAIIEQTTHFKGRVVNGWQPEWLAKRNMVSGILVPSGIVEVPTSMEELLKQVKNKEITVEEAAKLLPRFKDDRAAA